MDSRLLGFPFSGFWWIPQNPIFMQICKLSGDWSQSNALITYNLITAVVTSNSDDKPTKNGNLQPKEIFKNPIELNFCFCNSNTSMKTTMKNGAQWKRILFLGYFFHVFSSFFMVRSLLADFPIGYCAEVALHAGETRRGLVDFFDEHGRITLPTGFWKKNFVEKITLYTAATWNSPIATSNQLNSLHLNCIQP